MWMWLTRMWLRPKAPTTLAKRGSSLWLVYCVLHKSSKITNYITKSVVECTSTIEHAHDYSNKFSIFSHSKFFFLADHLDYLIDHYHDLDHHFHCHFCHLDTSSNHQTGHPSPESRQHVDRRRNGSGSSRGSRCVASRAPGVWTAVYAVVWTLGILYLYLYSGFINDLLTKARGTGNFDMTSVFFFNNCSTPPPPSFLMWYNLITCVMFLWHQSHIM